MLTLGTLANNGGDTETIALLPGSTAIDAGSASIAGVTVPRLDQRGALRGPAGLNAGPAVDIGAYEASSSYLVTTSQDLSEAGSLRAGILWANFSTNANPANLAKPAPNTVVFDTAGVFAQPQTITLTGGTLVLHPGRNSPVAIDGPGANALAISGNNTVGVISIAAGVMATLSDLTITGGSAADGGGINNFGNLTLSDVAITHNTAGFGGGIDNEVSGTLTVLNATLADNSATNDGGGIENSSGAIATITNTTLAGNSAVLGGGISNAGTLTAVNATIAYNTATNLRSAGGLDVSPAPPPPCTIRSSRSTPLAPASEPCPATSPARCLRTVCST